MSEEKTPVKRTAKITKEEAEAFFKKHADIIRWIPIALCGMLGLVLLLAPLGQLLPATIKVRGFNSSAYDSLSFFDKLEYGFTVPVIFSIALGGLSFLFAVFAAAFRKLRQSLACDICASIFTVLAFIIGTSQTAFFRSEYNAVGAFPVICLVFGLVFALLSIGEFYIHYNFIASRDDIIRWKTTFNKYKPWIYLAPAIILLLVFTVWPIFNTIRMSMLVGYNINKEIGGTTFKFGFDNYAKVFKDGFDAKTGEYAGGSFVKGLGTTMLLTVLTVPISTMLALLIAVGLNSIKFVKKTLQTIFFLPYVTNSIAVGMVFMAMFSMLDRQSNGTYAAMGLINNVIEAFGGQSINWVNPNSDYFANIAVLTIYIVWNALPFKILILLGGLQSVNTQYYDAAKIDGTSRVRTFWRITVPLLSPMIAYVIITGFIGGFKEYSSVLGIFGPNMGPIDHEVDTMVGYIMDNISGNQGKASAGALVLFAIIFAVTMVNLYVSNKKVHY